jgi:hypothetical protein
VHIESAWKRIVVMFLSLARQIRRTPDQLTGDAGQATDGFHPAAHSNRAHMGAMLHVNGASVRSIRGNQLLLVFVGIAVAAGASSEGFNHLWEAHLLMSFTFPAFGSLVPVVWFWVLNAVGARLGFAAIQGVCRLKITRDPYVARMLLLLQCGWIVCVLVFGLTSTFVVAAVAIWCKRVVESTSERLFNTWQTRVTAVPMDEEAVGLWRRRSKTRCCVGVKSW